MQVALIEADPNTGGCTFRGRVPSKALLPRGQNARRTEARGRVRRVVRQTLRGFLEVFDLPHPAGQWVPSGENLGHQRMVMRYAHLSPGYLSDEIHKLDGFRLRPSAPALAEVTSPSPAPAPPSEGTPPAKGKKGQSAPRAVVRRPRFAILLGKMAPQAGFEPATLRLTG
jgi:hypothetical protein